VNVELVTPSTVRRQATRRPRPHRAADRVTFRAGASADAAELYRLIDAYAGEGHLLARQLDDLTVNAPRFVIAERRGVIIGCAELAPLSGRVAEVRSLVVERSARGWGIGRSLAAGLQERARVDGYESLSAFTHDATFFVRLGFSLVPHSWVPEKIVKDCVTCLVFRRCGQHAVVLPVAATKRASSAAFVPLATLRG
jgi:N-acetylglutamate synthase-like GNAT family acetyltransferase